jgi:hypothetical protein
VRPPRLLHALCVFFTHRSLNRFRWLGTGAQRILFQDADCWTIAFRSTVKDLASILHRGLRSFRSEFYPSLAINSLPAEELHYLGDDTAEVFDEYSNDSETEQSARADSKNVDFEAVSAMPATNGLLTTPPR